MIAQSPQPNADLMSVSPDGEFATNLLLLMKQHRPTRVIETGTYLGTGTTGIICTGLHEMIADGIPVEDLQFITIEANPEWVKKAREHIEYLRSDHFTKVLEGLSIPRRLLPTPAEIQEWTVTKASELGLAVEHEEDDRVYRYWAETAFEEGPDDLLGEALKRVDYRPALVVLDSAAHVGWSEFVYVFGELKGPCFFALDDINHVKHYRSLQMMLDDRRFDVRCVGTEKFGYCIARYEP